MWSRVRSGLTQWVNVIEGIKHSIGKVFLRSGRGQLRFLGLIRPPQCGQWRFGQQAARGDQTDRQHQRHAARQTD
jgi:hypothetical protein